MSHPPQKPSDRAAFAAAQWRRERPDLDPFPMEVLGRLAEASQHISRDRLLPLFERYGLQGGEFDVLATLRRSGDPCALTPTALYEATMVSSGGMTNRLDRLEKAGFIERQRHPTDRRGTLVVLTPQGRALIDELLPLHIQNEQTVLSVLTSDEQQMLNDLLRKLQGISE
ncbi:MarR family winged helix-turn-helix transcriptional regulator [Insolitispirillum peregrinum]|nr:MarR family transcriptional regulator [Insolitispirillum peregrinum]